MKVVDLFSGAGGFSLGFDYAGFEVAYALDSWKVACESFGMNFPKAEVVCEDALKLTPDDIPDADVIIGGPPCQAFSVANVRHEIVPEDFALINWFLEVVEAKRPKWWIMENVPPVKPYLPMGIMKNTYRMCDYGVPQIRRRIFAGCYNKPPKCPTKALFPLVTATEYRSNPSSRQMSRLYNTFNRKSLIPECLLVQTFPLDYLLAGSLKDRYIQVGNAVPPLMAYRLADALINPTVKNLMEELG